MRKLIADMNEVAKLVTLCLTSIILLGLIIAGIRLSQADTKLDVPTINEPQPYYPEQTCDPYTNINCGVSP